MLDGNRVQGSRVAGNDWQVTVTPNNTTVVSVYANSTNVEFNAAVVSVPITVTNTTTTTTVTTPNHTVQIPPPPANLGPIAIASVTETPAASAGEVQLTVVTGIETSEVWVNFDRVNNARATGRFARATMVTQGTNSRTWVINFRPASWTVQQVEVGSNRTYNWPGAATQVYNLTLAQPFVAPITPRINSVTVNPRTILQNSTTTFTINTNLDAEHVWVRDSDGREHNAHRTTSTATVRNWTVSFSPGRTGAVTVFANSTRTETGAATRTENISVGHGGASIIGTPSAQRISSNLTRVNVTTNGTTESVWAIMPGTNHRVALRRTSTATGNRTWSEDVWTPEDWGNITIGVSSQSGNINNLSSEDSRTISFSNTGTGTGTSIHSADHRSNADREVRRGDIVEYRIITTDYVNSLSVTGNHVYWFGFTTFNTLSNNRREWIVSVEVSHNHPVNQNFAPVVHAHTGSGTTQVDSRTLPNTWIRS
jgi:hypothetical protein